MGLEDNRIVVSKCDVIIVDYRLGLSNGYADKMNDVFFVHIIVLYS